VWVTDSTIGFHRLENAATRPKNRAGVRLLTDRHGSLWWEPPPGIVARARDSGGGCRSSNDTGSDRSARDGVYALFEDRDGNIWAGTTEGLNRLTPRRIMQLVDLGYQRRGDDADGTGGWGPPAA